jgi:hypothetical protein
MLDFCTTILVYPENLLPFDQINRKITAWNTYKAVKRSWPLSGHLSTLLDSLWLIRPLRGQKVSPLFVHTPPPHPPPRALLGADLVFTELYIIWREVRKMAAYRIQISITCVRYDRCSRVMGGHRVHRVATATFWRTFHNDGKISPGWWG